MQKPRHLRPQVASNVHLVRYTMSERLICILLKLRLLGYEHQTVLPTNCLIMLPQAINVGDRVPGVDGTIDTCWYGPDLPEKLWRAKVQHGKELLAADEQRATAERARSLTFLAGYGLQFYWGNVHQLGLVKTHQPGRRCHSRLIPSNIFIKGTHIKEGQIKKPPNNDAILGEETQKGCGEKKSACLKCRFSWLPAVTGDDWFMPWKIRVFLSSIFKGTFPGIQEFQSLNSLWKWNLGSKPCSYFWKM